jgi:hypothetical protein
LIFLATLFVFPLMVPAAAAFLFLARKWGFVPATVGWVAFLLFLFLGYGLLYLVVALNSLLVTPDRLQKQYLGQRVAGPLALVRHEAGGFQDPYQVWHYRLTPAQRAALAPRCQWDRGFGRSPVCYLFSGMDERWTATVSLEGDHLVIFDGLH